VFIYILKTCFYSPQRNANQIIHNPESTVVCQHTKWRWVILTESQRSTVNGQRLVGLVVQWQHIIPRSTVNGQRLVGLVVQWQYIIPRSTVNGQRVVGLVVQWQYIIPRSTVDGQLSTRRRSSSSMAMYWESTVGCQHSKCRGLLQPRVHSRVSCHHSQ